MHGAQILLVEEDDVLRDVITRNLHAHHHQVQSAGDSASALELLRVAPFDLVFLDINLPNQTGWEVLHIALSEHRLPLVEVVGQGLKLPIVVLSAVPMSAERRAEFPLLASLPKPFSMSVLLGLAREAGIRREAKTNERS